LHTGVAIRNKKATWQFWYHPSGRAWRDSCVTPTPSGLFSPPSSRRGIGALLHHHRRLAAGAWTRAAPMLSWRDRPRASESRLQGSKENAYHQMDVGAGFVRGPRLHIAATGRWCWLSLERS